MEQAFSGYCRVLDAARMVWCESEDGKTETDCNFPDCPYRTECAVGQAITVWMEEAK